MTAGRRSASAAAACLIATTLLCSCGSSRPDHAPTTTSAHAVTTSEADRLAVSRFLNYQSGGVYFTVHLVTNQTPLAIAGDVDYQHRVGYAQVTGAGSGFTVQWNAAELLAWPAGAQASVLPTQLPATTPTKRSLAPTTSLIDAVLAVMLNLGQDRPDNAQLIRQDGARWLRAATVGGTRVDVIAGPRATGSTAADASTSTSPLTYWIGRTGRMLRVDASFGGGAPTPIMLDAQRFAPFPRSVLLKS